MHPSYTSCLVHPVDRFDSEGWFSSDQMIFETVFHVFVVKKYATFKWKDAISEFPVSPGSAEAVIRWGGKIKYILIAYFLSNICAKNCRNRTVYVKIIASCKGGTFFETRCIARQSYIYTMMRRWRFFASCISASRVQHFSYLHSKFALRPHYVWKNGRHPICDGWD